MLPLVPAVATSRAAAFPRRDHTSSVRPQHRQTRATHYTDSRMLGGVPLPL